jgi:hypothetical protein
MFYLITIDYPPLQAVAAATVDTTLVARLRQPARAARPDTALTRTGRTQCNTF